MDVRDFWYDLPQELIAQDPLEDRASSRLLVLDKVSGDISHKHFFDIIDYLNEGDCLVLNETKVIPARLMCVKKDTGAAIEKLLLKRKSKTAWECLVKPGKKCKVGAKIDFGDGLLLGTIVDIVEEGNRIIEFEFEGIFEEILDKLGTMPLPPYITHVLKDKNRYQTVYAKNEGSAAAPTAGLHFTKELLGEIVNQINTVLYTIIPGMRIDTKDYGKQTLDSGEEGWKVELMSVRGDKKPIPIRMESDGIIKIISILNALIQAFSNSSICLVIDELDAGIFEYLLGELLDIFSKSAKGQLIFTSHNLRALEMLDKESIMFSTVNPDNRYIHMKNVKDSNNLRSMYIRSITLGGQEETIYEETDSLKISRAFRKAGKLLYEERKKSCNGNS